jgi:hypothetical protein
MENIDDILYILSTHSCFITLTKTLKYKEELEFDQIQSSVFTGNQTSEIDDKIRFHPHSKLEEESNKGGKHPQLNSNHHYPNYNKRRKLLVTNPGDIKNRSQSTDSNSNLYTMIDFQKSFDNIFKEIFILSTTDSEFLSNNKTNDKEKNKINTTTEQELCLIHHTLQPIVNIIYDYLYVKFNTVRVNDTETKEHCPEFDVSFYNRIDVNWWSSKSKIILNIVSIVHLVNMMFFHETYHKNTQKSISMSQKINCLTIQGKFVCSLFFDKFFNHGLQQYTPQKEYHVINNEHEHEHTTPKNELDHTIKQKNENIIESIPIDKLIATNLNESLHINSNKTLITSTTTTTTPPINDTISTNDYNFHCQIDEKEKNKFLHFHKTTFLFKFIINLQKYFTEQYTLYKSIASSIPGLNEFMDQNLFI